MQFNRAQTQINGYSSFLSGLFSSIDVSPCVTFASIPRSTASHAANNAANANNSPTAANTEPSMIPIGGTKHDPIISRVEIAVNTAAIILALAHFVLFSSIWVIVNNMQISRTSCYLQLCFKLRHALAAVCEPTDLRIIAK